MNPLPFTIKDALTIAGHQLRLTFRGRKVFLCGVALLALAGLPALVRALDSVGPQAGDLQRAQIVAMMKFFPREVVRALIDCPAPLTVALVITLFFQPAYVLLLGAEAIAGDLQTGAVRFSIMRASRSAVLMGEALGLWATICALTFAVHACVWLLAAVGPSRDPGGVWRWGPKLYLVCCATALVYVSIVTFLGTLTKRTSQLAAAGILVLGGARLTRGWLQSQRSAAGSWLPGALDERLLSPDPAQVLGGVTFVLCWSAVCLLSASVVFKWRDL